MTDHLSHGEKLVEIDDVELCLETFGNPANPAVLLIDGATASMLWWETGLCERIARGDRFVIRYDNRDTGRSTSYPPGRPGYTFTDLAGDALGVLDTVDVERAHIVCRSMSGGIGLILGVDHPDRVESLTFVSTSTGEDGLPPPSDELTGGTPASPDPADSGAVVDFVVASAKACSGGSPYFDERATRALVERDVARTRDPAATLVNHYAMTFDGSSRDFASVETPTLVVHGDHDPVFPLPHGHALRDAIPGATLLTLGGAGHDLPKPLWDGVRPGSAPAHRRRPAMTRWRSVGVPAADLRRARTWETMTLDQARGALRDGPVDIGTNIAIAIAIAIGFGIGIERIG